MKTGIATMSLDSPKILFRHSGIDIIPSGPKIPLKNYLLDLVADSDRKGSSIYLKGVEKFIQEIWDEMIPNNWRKLKLDIAKTLGIHPVGFYAYKNGKKAISIQMMHRLLLLWESYCRKSERHIKEKWNDIYRSNFIFSVRKGSGPTKLPKHLSPKLSYLIGFICGDGHLSDYGNHYLLRLSDKSINHLHYLRFLFTDIFDVKISLYQIYKGGYALQLGNKAIYRFLTQILKIKVGKIPEFVKEIDPINRKYFLIGIFDSEGHVDSSYLNSKITISQSSRKFLEEMIDFFEDLGISFSGPYLHKTILGRWYTIQIRKKSEILKYMEEIGSHHIDKLQKFKLLKKEIYANGYRHATA